MSYNLFLDDMREVKDVKWIDLPPYHWVVVKSYNQFVSTIKERGIPSSVSFDHDLAEEHYKEYHFANDKKMLSFGTIRYDRFKEKTGYEAAQFLAEHCINTKTPIPEYYVHTLNNIGRLNIISVLESAKKSLTIP
jgi:hypothetical protein